MKLNRRSSNGSDPFRGDWKKNNFLKRCQLDWIRDVEGMEEFKDGTDYLKTATTFFWDVLEDMWKMISASSPGTFTTNTEDLDIKFRKLESTREDSEEERGEKFAVTRLFEQNELSRDQKVVMLSLLTKQGIGVKISDPFLSGEELIFVLYLLNEKGPHDARKILSSNSQLVDEELVKVIHPSNYGHPDRPAPIESRKYYLPERVVEIMLGNEKMDEDKCGKDREERR